MKYFQASEIRFSKACLPLKLFFLLLSYTEFISWTNGLRNVHRIPNNASPIPFTIAFKSLLFTKLASYLFFFRPVLYCWFAFVLRLVIHSSWFLLLMCIYIHSFSIYSRNSFTTHILLHSLALSVVGSHIIHINSFCRLKLIHLITWDTSVLWINNNT